MTHQFSTVQAAVDAISRGEVIIVIDAVDRENEGDFICAAEMVTPEIVNFMITHGRGQVCVPMLSETADRLKLEPVTDVNNAPLHTGFLTPIDHATARTGITAQERALTIKTTVAPDASPSDFVRPGHVFPILAKPGGVLRCAGHTEATVDLARMAGLTPVGVLCEILNDSGDRATRDELLAIAEKYKMEIISIEELIKHRRVSEKLVHRQAEAKLPTRYGDFNIFVYRVDHEEQEPLVLTTGDLSKVDAPLVRLHSSCFTGDLIESLRCDCGDQLKMALEMIAAEGAGALVYLPQEGRGIGLTQKIKAYALQDEGMDTVEANHALGFKADIRDYGIGIQLLKDLGLKKVRLLTNNPKKTDAFIYGGFDLTVVDQVPINPPINPHNEAYLKTKREKLGHQLPE